jgi:membrane protease YdiL (CAAX protease family)
MTATHSSPASGWQIAFLVFSVAVLATPVSRSLASASPWLRDNESLVARFIMFTVAILCLAGLPRVRGACRQMLSAPIARQHRAEVAFIAAVVVIGNFAAGGGIALSLWLEGGDALLAAKMQIRGDERIAQATSLAGLLLIPLAWCIGPVVEELVFRGFLYRAWARRWHWLIALGLTAVTFGLYHPFLLPSMASSILFTCLMRRTGSLWSAIAVHVTSNTTLWYPFLGQFVFPADAGTRVAHLSTWSLHLGCLAAFAIFLPFYVWMARDRNVARRQALELQMALCRS